MTTLLVIPARWGSTRFPGKPLAQLAGRTLLARAIDLAARSIRICADASMVVATDDDRIVDAAVAAGCPAIMTDPAITSGSGRALAAAIDSRTPATRIINLQVDAPLLPAVAVEAVLVGLADDPAADCVTPVVQLDWPALEALRESKRVEPFSGTCCVRDAQGWAIWFSKQIVPAIRDEQALRASGPFSPVFRHLGVYGYTITALKRFEGMPPSAYERLEGLEQLRLIEAGMRIRTVLVDAPVPVTSGIDTPHDLAAAERAIATCGDPFGR